MKTYRYRIYYKFLGPTASDPFATAPLSAHDVAHHLNGLEDLLRLSMPDPSAEVKIAVAADQASAIASVATAGAEMDADNSLARRIAKLNMATPGLSLLMERVPGP